MDVTIFTIRCCKQVHVQCKNRHFEHLFTFALLLFPICLPALHVLFTLPLDATIPNLVAPERNVWKVLTTTLLNGVCMCVLKETCFEIPKNTPVTYWSRPINMKKNWNCQEFCIDNSDIRNLLKGVMFWNITLSLIMLMKRRLFLLIWYLVSITAWFSLGS